MTVLLVSRSVTHHSGHDAIRRLAAATAQKTGLPVRACFLDGAEPSLHAALDTLPDHDDVLLVAVHVPPDRYLDSWIRRAVAHWRADRGRPLHVTVSAPMAEQNSMVTAVTEAIAADTAELAGHPGPFRSPAWSQITRHQRHVLICRGPRCTAYGANDVASAISDRLRHHGLGDNDVLVTATGCLVPCNLGPLVVVHPDDTWYEHVDSALAERIADEHLRHSQPVDGKRPRGSAEELPRQPRPGRQ